MKKIIVSLFVLIFCIPVASFCQDENEKQEFCSPVSDKKAIKLYEKGKNRKKYTVKKERLEFLKEALKIEPDFVEAQFALANELLVSWKLGKMEFAPIAPLLKNIIRLCPNLHSDPYYYVGMDYYNNEKFDSAKKYITAYMNFKDSDESKFANDYAQQIDQCKQMLAQLKIDMAKDSKIVPFDPRVVVPISTKYDEFLCAVAPDDNTFYFTRREPYSSKNLAYQTEEFKETFMYAKREKDGKWTEAEAMPPPFNKNAKEGGPSLTIDNNRLYYTIFANDGAGMNADIYYSDYDSKAEEWSVPQKVPNINDPVSWDSQPSISADGNTLFFVSDREGGFGKTDIYMAFKNPVTKQFGKPINVGRGINTPYKEKCPFIHSDSETLYFSSEGMPSGYGGLDIYMVRKDEKGNWKTPENLGAPINTPEDDAGLFVSTDGEWGYFAAQPSGNIRGIGIGGFDIYRFELYKEARPQEMTMIRGDLRDKDGAMLHGASVELKNPTTKEKIDAVVDSAYGSFVVAVNKSKFTDKVVLNVKKEDQAFSATVIDVKDADFKNQPKPVQMVVQPISLNESIVINDIHYKSNSAELEPASFVMLDEFVEWMKENPKIKIEIGGHTDNVGTPNANLALSGDRAFTVKAYLEDKGIEGKRVTAKGYGDKVPVAENSTEEGRAANRRTEFKILAK